MALGFRSERKADDEEDGILTEPLYSSLLA